MSLPVVNPHHLNHYLAACAVAQLSPAFGTPQDARDVIAHVAMLSIPDAIAYLSARAAKVSP